MSERNVNEMQSMSETMEMIATNGSPDTTRRQSVVIELEPRGVGQTASAESGEGSESLDLNTSTVGPEFDTPDDGVDPTAGTSGYSMNTTSTNDNDSMASRQSVAIALESAVIGQMPGGESLDITAQSEGQSRDAPEIVDQREESGDDTDNAPALDDPPPPEVADASELVVEPPENMTFGTFSEYITKFFLALYVLDILTDYLVACRHYYNDDYLYCSLTLAFVFIPSLVMTGIMLRWNSAHNNDQSLDPIFRSRWLNAIVISVGQLGPIMKYIGALKYGYLSRQPNTISQIRRHYRDMIYENMDGCELKLIEAFIEAPLQLILQLYILAIHGYSSWTQVAGVFTSWISISVSVASLHWALVLIIYENPPNVWPELIVQALWHSCIIATRVLTLTLFAIQFGYYLAIVVSVHFVAMFVLEDFWLPDQYKNLCNSLYITNRLYDQSVLVFIYTFNFLQPVDTRETKRFIANNIAMFAQNIILITLLATLSDYSEWYTPTALYIIYIAYPISICLMFVHYFWFNPFDNLDAYAMANIARRRDHRPYERKISKWH